MIWRMKKPKLSRHVLKPTPGRERVLRAFRSLACDGGTVTLQAVADRLCLSKTTVYEHVLLLVLSGDIETEMIDRKRNGFASPPRKSCRRMYRYRVASHKRPSAVKFVPKFIHRPGK